MYPTARRRDAHVACIGRSKESRPDQNSGEPNSSEHQARANDCVRSPHQPQNDTIGFLHGGPRLGDIPEQWGRQRLPGRSAYVVTREARCAATADSANPACPRSGDEWKRLYRGRSAVEREFGRLKHHYALAMLRVRGIERVRLHADLTIMGRLALALSQARSTSPSP